MNRHIFAATAILALSSLALWAPAQAATTCAEQLKAVKAQLDAARAHVMKDQAQMHYMDAEKAHESNNEKQCMEALLRASNAIDKANIGTR